MATMYSTTRPLMLGNDALGCFEANELAHL